MAQRALDRTEMLEKMFTSGMQSIHNDLSVMRQETHDQIAQLRDDNAQQHSIVSERIKEFSAWRAKMGWVVAAALLGGMLWLLVFGLPYEVRGPGQVIGDIGDN